MSERRPLRTARVRIAAVSDRGGCVHPDSFDRWLESERATARERGRREGLADGWDEGYDVGTEAGGRWAENGGPDNDDTNPYRTGVDQ